MAIFSKLKGGKTQSFSKLKLLLGKTQGKYSKTQYFGNFCRDGPFFNIVNEVTTTSLYICECKLDRNSTFLQNSRYFFSKLQAISAQNSMILAKLNFSEIPSPYDGAKTTKKEPDLLCPPSCVKENCCYICIKVWRRQDGRHPRIASPLPEAGLEPTVSDDGRVRVRLRLVAAGAAVRPPAMAIHPRLQDPSQVHRQAAVPLQVVPWNLGKTKMFCSLPSAES